MLMQEDDSVKLTRSLYSELFRSVSGRNAHTVLNTVGECGEEVNDVLTTLLTRMTEAHRRRWVLLRRLFLVFI